MNKTILYTIAFIIIKNDVQLDMSYNFMHILWTPDENHKACCNLSNNVILFVQTGCNE